MTRYYTKLPIDKVKEYNQLLYHVKLNDVHHKATKYSIIARIIELAMELGTDGKSFIGKNDLVKRDKSIQNIILR